VLCGKLWHLECQEKGGDFPSNMPVAFEDVAQYIGTFEPLLCEEAREAVRSSWVEHSEARHGFGVQISRCLASSVI
jgi:hypothetical protein